MKKSKQLNCILIVISLLLLFKCSMENAVLPVGNPEVHYTDSSVANPNNESYQSLLDTYVSKGFPGMMMLVKTPENGLWVGAAGMARIEDKTPLTPHHLIYSGSIAKSYTAASIMLLCERGILSLDDKISTYLTDDIYDNIANFSNLTIRHLVSMTSGIPDWDDDDRFFFELLNNPLSLSTADVIKSVCRQDQALFKPGKQLDYSSSNFVLLAKIIEKATNQNHAEFFTINIFNPGKLQNTFYKNESRYPKPEGLVNVYWDKLTSGLVENVSNFQNHYSKIEIGDAGIIASLYDYYQFFQQLFDGKIVSEESLQEMKQWRTDGEEFYGYGLFKRETKWGNFIGHDGDAIGSKCDVFYSTETDIFIAYATNIGDGKIIHMYDKFWEDILQLVFPE